jgi:hypothetical protein
VIEFDDQLNGLRFLLDVERVWGAHFRSASRGASLVLVDQPAEAVASDDASAR